MHNNQSGQSLVQVLISVAIMGVVLTAMSSMFNSLNRETKAMSEKLGAMDLEKVLIASMADGSACLYALKNPTEITFPSTAPMSDTSPFKIPLVGSPARLYSSYNATSPTPLGPVIVEAGKQASPASSSLVVSGISLELTGLSGATVNGRWRIDFDNSRLARPIKPVYVSVALKADLSNPAAAKFTTCQVTSSTPSGSGGSGDWCGAFGGAFDGVTGSEIDIYTVYMKCKGKDPQCAPGRTPMAGPVGHCLASPFIYGWDLNSVCPSGYTIRLVFDTGNNPGEQKLYTCEPN